MRQRLAVLGALALFACAPGEAPGRSGDLPFPPAKREVASIVSDHSGPEAERDAAGEARRVIDALGIGPGLRVADIGAGAGYHTVRLSPVVGPQGRVIAQDVTRSHQERLRRRVASAGLTNVDFVLGRPDDARLPPRSIDVVLLVRMYHEIEHPYALMWRLHESLRPGGRVAIAERDRPIVAHGTPPALLRCEMAAVGFRETAFHDLGESGYLAVFEPAGPPPAPGAIKPCE